MPEQVTDDGITPLWWLPDDEEKALEIAQLLLAAGADPARQEQVRKDRRRLGVETGHGRSGPLAHAVIHPASVWR